MNKHICSELISLSAELAQCDKLFSACRDTDDERASSLYEEHCVS